MPRKGTVNIPISGECVSTCMVAKSHSCSKEVLVLLQLYLLIHETHNQLNKSCTGQCVLPLQYWLTKYQGYEAPYKYI